MGNALQTLTGLGFSVSLDGQNIRVEPAKKITADIRQFIRNKKPELVDILKRHWRYRITPQHSEAFELKTTPPITVNELAMRLPGTLIDALPDQDPPKRKPSLSEIAEMKDLAQLIYRDERDQCEAVELALQDIDAGLLVLRQLAAVETADRRQCGLVCCRECAWFVAENRACGKQCAPTPTTLWRRCADFRQ